MNQRDADLRAVAGGPAGRRFLARLIEQSGLTDASLVPGNPEATAYNEGRRAVARALTDELRRVCPQLWAQMVREGLEAFELAATAVQEESLEDD